MTKMSVNLSSLIKLVKQRPEIYSKHYSPTEYDNAWKAREAAWEDVSKRLQTDSSVLKKKWRTLRDQFQRHYKKVQASNGVKIEVQWPYFEKLLFLKEHCRSKESCTNSNRNREDRYDDNDTQMSNAAFDTEDGYYNDEDVKVHTFDTKFESLSDEAINNGSEDRVCDDYYLVSTSADLNDECSSDERVQKICDSNTIDENLHTSLSRRKRKLDESSSSNVKISIQRAKYLENADDNNLDRQIVECLETIKMKSETAVDHIDHFCNFIGSMIRQWSSKKQCEAMNYFTNYVMENHTVFKKAKE